MDRWVMLAVFWQAGGTWAVVQVDECALEKPPTNVQGKVYIP
jgi:hypothetical protein